MRGELLGKKRVQTLVHHFALLTYVELAVALVLHTKEAGMLGSVVQQLLKQEFFLKHSTFLLVATQNFHSGSSSQQRVTR